MTTFEIMSLWEFRATVAWARSNWVVVLSSIVTLYPKDGVFDFAAVRRYFLSRSAASALEKPFPLRWVNSDGGGVFFFLSLRDLMFSQCECALQPRLAALSQRLRLSRLFWWTVLLSASIQTKQLPLLLWALNCYGLWKKSSTFFFGLC